MGAGITINLPEIVGGGYKQFWNCRKRYRVVKGGKASKKSSTAALWFIYHLMKYPGANLLVVRNVFNTHRDSTYSQLKWAVKRFQVDKYWRCIENPLEMQYTPNGNRILFRDLTMLISWRLRQCPRGICAGFGSRKRLKSSRSGF